MPTKNIPSKVIYSDFTMNLDKHPLTKDVARQTNEQAVKSALRNLILTDRGERPFQPDLGGNIRAMLFENFTPQTILNTKQIIEDTIQTFEPRAGLIDVIVSPSEDHNTIAISITFYLVNIQEPTTLDFILTRVR